MAREYGVTTVIPGRRQVTVRCNVHDDYADAPLSVTRFADTEEKARQDVRWELRRQIIAAGKPLLNGGRTFHIASAMWLDTLCAYRTRGTVSKYTINLQVYAIPELGALRLVDIDAPRLRQYFAHLDDTPMTRRARVDARFTVMAVLGFAVRHGALPENPMYALARLPEGIPA